MAYQLKQLPEDFIVKEISKVELKPNGRYLYFKLKKRGHNTLTALTYLAKKLNLKETQFGFAGNKDKEAVTEQVCSVYGTSKDKLLGVRLSDISIEFLGYGDAPIALGDLGGNKFEIVIRNLNKEIIMPIKYFPNYFDEQRFSKSNVERGEALVRKDFKTAVKLEHSKECELHLQKIPTDFVGALKQVPMRLLRLYVNSYQSRMWNETLARYLRKKGKVMKEEDYSQGKLVFVEKAEQFSELNVPIIGFDAEELDADVEIKKIIVELMQEEKLEHADFIIKQIPQLTLEGELRKGFAEVKELVVGKEEKDELNPGKKKVKVSFRLGKGSYATVAIRVVVNFGQ
ncbi:tRNA pseudouridine(13) synthase TruD [Candidatus Woesearchaeota archaeon]|nr:tRNA pseudouridine(13) synthase TruD [Candidatus Woesearchaeota archaeon]